MEGVGQGGGGKEEEGEEVEDRPGRDDRWTANQDATGNRWI